MLAAAGCGGEAAPAERPAAGRAEETGSPPGKRTAAGVQAPATARVTAGMAADEQAIAALVRRRAESLAGGRTAAYSAPATGARRRRDAADARRADRIGVRAVRVERLRVRIRGGRAVAPIRLSYRLDRLPGRWTYARVLRLRRTERGWRVAAVRSRALRPPWELAGYRRIDARHFSVFAPRGVDPAEVALEATLEQAHATIRRRLPGRTARRYPVFVADNFDDMAAMTPGIRDVGRLIAITDLSVRTSGPAQRVTEVVGARILIPWPSFRALDPATRERVLTHELAHAVLAPATSGRAPAWLQEGIALYVSGDRRTATAAASLPATAGASSRRSSALARLARPDAMAALAGRELSAAYALSSSTAHYIAATFGSDTLLDLLAAFGDESLEGGPGRSLTDRATRRVLGIGVRRLERDVGTWLRAGAAPAGG